MGVYTFRNMITAALVEIEAVDANSAKAQLPPGGPWIARRSSKPSPPFITGGLNVIEDVEVSYDSATGLITITPPVIQAIAGVTPTIIYEAFFNGDSAGQVTSPFTPAVNPATHYVRAEISAVGFETVYSISLPISVTTPTSAPAFVGEPQIIGSPVAGSLLTISFSVTGSPTPTVTGIWKANGTTIPGQSGLQLPGSLTAALAAGTVITAQASASNGIGGAVVADAANSITLETAAAFIGETSVDGSFIIIDLPAGFPASGTVDVDPSKIAVQQTVPSKSSVGVDNTATVSRRVGTKATVEGTKLKVWMLEPVSRFATAITFVADAAAITSGAVSSGAMSGTIQPRCVVEDANVKARIIGVVKSRTDMRMPLDLVDGTVYLEAFAFHESGLACVEFVVTDGVTTQTHYATSFSPSRYQDDALVSDAQWSLNGTASGNSALAGLGVIASTGIAMSAFAEGAITITMTAYAKAGGDNVKVAETWTVFNNKGGYTDRIRYVDSLDGLDTNDGLTEGTAFKTLSKAMSEAAAASKGAVEKDVPIIYCVGSGDPDAPRQYTIVDGTTNAGITDTYATITPAPGYSMADTRIRAAASKALRARRVKFKDIDISLQAGNQIMALMNNWTAYDATNPATVMIKGGRVWHPGFASGGNPLQPTTLYLLGSSYSNANKSQLILLDTQLKEMSGAFLCSLCPSIVRNVSGNDCTNDLIKGPSGTYFGINFNHSEPPRNVLPFPKALTGTPIIGETVSGLLSGASGIVGSVPRADTVFLSERTGNFKGDDNKNHRAILVADGSAFQVGENIGGSRKILRKDGNTLRIEDINWSPSVGSTITGSVSGASSTVVSLTTEGNIFFETSGVRGKLQLLHFDGLQVQTFFGSKAVFEMTSGTFVVGDKLTRAGDTKNTILGFETSPDGRLLLVLNSGGNEGQLDTDDEDKNMTGSISGAKGIFRGYWSMHPNNLNMVMANVWLNDVEGQGIFVENGWNGAVLANWLITKLSDNLQMQLARATNFSIIHASVHQMTMLIRDNQEAQTKFRHQILGLLCEGLVKNLPGINIATCHNADPTKTSGGDFTAGDPLFVNGFAFNEVYDPTRSVLELQSGSPARRLQARGFGAWYPYDLFGNPRPTNGTAAIGAVEKWPVETSDNANLAALTFSQGTIAPTFAAGTTSYTASVAANVASVVVTPVTEDPTATVTVNGTAVAYGASSDPITLTAGSNVITVVVTASDGTTTKTYTNTITKAAAISLVSVHAASNGSSYNPSALAGDLIVVAAYRSSSAVTPSNPAGYTSKRGVNGGNQGLRVSTKIAAADGETVPVFDNAITRLIWVFRGATDIGAIDGAFNGSNSVPLLPALTMQGSGSYEIGAVCARGTTGYSDAESALAGFTQGAHLDNRRAFSKAPPTDGAEISAAAATDNATTGWHTFHAEVLAA